MKGRADLLRFLSRSGGAIVCCRVGADGAIVRLFSQGLVSNNLFKWSSAALPLSSVYSDTLYDFNLAAVLHSADQELHNVHFIM